MSTIPKSLINRQMLSDIRGFRSETADFSKDKLDFKEIKSEKPKKEFADYLKSEVSELNQVQKDAELSAAELASGKSESIHETMLKATNAELSFNLFVQLRNKALDAYQEVMRMQV